MKLTFVFTLTYCESIPIQTETIYQLDIELESGENLQAETRIPEHVAIDSFVFTPPPGANQIDTMARLLITISDPPGENFYRYMTAGEGESFRPGFCLRY